jgi:transcription antitermination factor NusG
LGSEHQKSWYSGNGSRFQPLVGSLGKYETMQNPKLKIRKILVVPVSRRGLNRTDGTDLEALFSDVDPTEENSFEENRPRNDAVPVWYCLRSRRNQESVAAARLQTLARGTVFCPQIRFRRRLSGSRKSLLVTEPLFPGYFFVRCLPTELLPAIERVADIWGVVCCDEKPAVIDDSLIETLRAETAAVVKEFTSGDSVRLTDGDIAATQAVITDILSAGERVQAFFDFLASGKSAQKLPIGRAEPLLLRFSTRFTVIDLGRPRKPREYAELRLKEQNLPRNGYAVRPSIRGSLLVDSQIIPDNSEAEIHPVSRGFAYPAAS